MEGLVQWKELQNRGTSQTEIEEPVPPLPPRRRSFRLPSFRRGGGGGHSGFDVSPVTPAVIVSQDEDRSNKEDIHLIR